MPGPEDRVARGLIAAAGCAALAAVVVAITGGGSLEVGGLMLRSHNPARPLFAAGLLTLIALTRGAATVAAALEWHWRLVQRCAAGAAVVLSIAAIAAGFRWGAFIAGGSDSYCYLNQA